MRTTFAAVAGLVAVAAAGTTTITDTVDVTITSCEPTVTNCPYKPTGDNTWSDWVSASTTSSKPVKPASTSTYDPSWSDWESTTSTKPVAAASTSTATWGDWESTTTKPVAAASTSTATWGDWESTATTPVAVTSTVACGVYTATAPPAWFSLLPSDAYSSIAAKWTGAPPADWCYYTYSASSLITATPVTTYTSKPVSPASTTSAVWSYSGNPVAPATFTGAANANTGSFALAGLAAAAALVMA